MKKIYLLEVMEGVLMEEGKRVDHALRLPVRGIYVPPASSSSVRLLELRRNEEPEAGG